MSDETIGIEQIRREFGNEAADHCHAMSELINNRPLTPKEIDAGQKYEPLAQVCLMRGQLWPLGERVNELELEGRVLCSRLAGSASRNARLGDRVAELERAMRGCSTCRDK